MGTRDTCSSCGKGLVGEGFSIFDCPECGDSIIGRCRSCREHSTKYSCEKCGYTSM
ncbi:MAG: zinc finger domain-containing protein [Candidatus Thermoplasmatota archaeon]|nr:zinc finger domain-containing protein [Candidatus Thermoplasmatota archaeon]MCL5987430.1 zinc finger domain-containing protein [Candidatus Thermoplasmatota archaeon]